MNSVIFYAMGQKFLSNRIRRILAENGDIVRCREIEINNTKSYLERHEIEAIKEYIGYLNAARRNPEKTYFLPSFDDGYLRYIWVRYSNYTVATLDLELTDELLPAIALDNRMVIMPIGILDLLRLNQQFSPAQEKILKDENEDDYYGISEIDFFSEERLRTCLKEKIEFSMSKIERAIANYLSFHGGISDVERIAEAMDVTLVCAQVGVNRIMGSGHNTLAAGFCSNKFQIGEWQLVTLCLTNNSEAEVSYVGAEIDGPIEIRKVSAQGILVPSQSVFLDLHLKPLEKGDFPIDIRIRLIEGNQEVFKSAGIEWITVM